MKCANLKMDLQKYNEDFKDRLLECFTMDEISSWDKEKACREMLDTLCHSFSSVLDDFIYDNREEGCFTGVINSEGYMGNIEEYCDDVISFNGNIEPFDSYMPVEFFNVLLEFRDSLSKTSTL